MSLSVKFRLAHVTGMFSPLSDCGTVWVGDRSWLICSEQAASEAILKINKPIRREYLITYSSTYWTEGLIGLSVRWGQPNQQQGRRIPSLSSLIVLLTCSFLVSSFLTKVTQHIHSFRASGIRSSHIASAALSEVRAFRKSAGTLCTTPAEIVLLIIWFYQTSGFRRQGWVDDSS